MKVQKVNKLAIKVPKVIITLSRFKVSLLSDY